MSKLNNYHYEADYNVIYLTRHSMIEFYFYFYFLFIFIFVFIYLFRGGIKRSRSTFALKR